MTEQTEMKEVEANKEEIAKMLQTKMTEAADELSKATNTKVCVIFWSEELKQAGSFASSNLTVLEERGLINLASR